MHIQATILKSPVAGIGECFAVAGIILTCDLRTNNLQISIGDFFSARVAGQKIRPATAEQETALAELPDRRYRFRQALKIRHINISNENGPLPAMRTRRAIDKQYIIIGYCII